MIKELRGVRQETQGAAVEGMDVGAGAVLRREGCGARFADGGYLSMPMERIQVAAREGQ